MISVTKAFLNVHWDQKSPLLLGYSGGPDSKALLYALLENGIKPDLAHVDHGWRSESAQEALELQEEAKQLGCPFFSVRLDREKSEDAARKGRFSFFQSLAGYQALLLAHQAEDLAETVLKRILEGAHLSFLGGMEPISRQGGMTIWRPLLGVRRSEIFSFLEERALKPILDATNNDPNYLRARMRIQIFPFLNEQFGKEILDNLGLLSERAYELKTYLDQQTAQVPVYKGPWGTLVLLEGLKRIEQRHLIQKIAREEGIVIPRETLETLLLWLEKGLFSKAIQVKTKKIWVDKGRIFFFSLDSSSSNSGICK